MCLLPEAPTENFGGAFVVPGRHVPRPDPLCHAGACVMDIAEADKAISIWLDVWAEATVAGQTDAAVEAAEELDALLRPAVVLT